MKTSIYQQAKKELKQISVQIKKEYPTDKPLQRQVINDYCDSLCKNNNLSEYQRNLLSNYSCTLQPKK